jgi:hypothetical protein
MSKLLKILGVLILGISLIIFNGFVITQLWNWFIVPLGVISISIAHAIGLSLIIGMLTLRINAEYKEMKPWEYMTISCIAYLMFWGMGAIVHLFM